MSGATFVSMLRFFALAAALLLPGPAASGPTLLFDAATGRVLYAEDADDQWHPASLTKIMTAYLTFQALKSGKLTLETPISYSEVAAQQPPSKIGLPVGATLSVDLALQSVIVKSANDIAVALAEAIGGNEPQFVELMNTTARRLGMTRTVFRNPHGLPAPEQVTTARDLARLATAAVREFPEYAHYWSMQQMQIGSIRIVTHNGLFKTLEGADGLKTGFICDSGYNIVASATRDGNRLIAVVLGGSTVVDRNQRAQELLEHGYATMAWKAALGSRDTITSMAAAPGVKDATSIRESVIAMECGNRRVAKAVAAQRRAKARNKVAAAKKPGEPAAPAITPGGTPATAKPAVTKPPVTKPLAAAPKSAQSQPRPAANAAAAQ